MTAGFVAVPPKWEEPGRALFGKLKSATSSDWIGVVLASSAARRLPDSLFIVRAQQMDWIERWFGVSPDNGDGTFELSIVIAAVLIGAIVLTWARWRGRSSRMRGLSGSARSPRDR